MTVIHLVVPRRPLVSFSEPGRTVAAPRPPDEDMGASMRRVWTGLRQSVARRHSGAPPRGVAATSSPSSPSCSSCTTCTGSRAPWRRGGRRSPSTTPTRSSASSVRFGFYWEPWLQARFSSFEPLMSVHDLVLPRGAPAGHDGVCLAWVFMRRREVWPLFRNWFLALNLIGLIFYTLVPTAPPRMLPWSGVVDMALPVSRRRGLRQRAEHLRQPLRGHAQPALRLRAVRGALRVRPGAAALAAPGWPSSTRRSACWRSS